MAFSRYSELKIASTISSGDFSCHQTLMVIEGRDDLFKRTWLPRTFEWLYSFYYELWYLSTIFPSGTALERYFLTKKKTIHSFYHAKAGWFYNQLSLLYHDVILFLMYICVYRNCQCHFFFNSIMLIFLLLFWWQIHYTSKLGESPAFIICFLTMLVLITIIQFEY